MEPYYYKQIENCLKSVMYYFSDYKIIRQYANKQKEYKIPIVASSRSTIVQKLHADLEKERNIEDVLPRMGLAVTYIDKASGISKNTNPRLANYIETGNTRIRLGAGVPIKVGFSLTIHVKHMREALNIAEMMMMTFNHKFTIPLLETELNHRQQMHFILDASPVEFLDEWGPGEDRLIELEFKFHTTIKVYPKIEEVKPIKTVIINAVDLDDEDSNYFTSTWYVDPQTANKEDDHEQVGTISEEGGTPIEYTRIEVEGED